MYDGTHHVFQNDPHLHAVAIYQALVSEGVHSGILHDLQLARTGPYLTSLLDKRAHIIRDSTKILIEDVYQWWLAENTWSIHYQSDMFDPVFLDMIDDRLGLSVNSLVSTLRTNVVHIL